MKKKFVEDWHTAQPASRKGFSRFVRSLFDNVLKGLIVVSPVVITVYALGWAFALVDDILPNVLQFVVNIFNPSRRVQVPHFFGLGVVVFVLALAGVGYFSSFFVFNRLLRLLDSRLLATSGVKVPYAFAKDLIKTFKNDGRTFTQPVLFSTDEKQEVWRMGFITSEELSRLGIAEDWVTVYVPMSFSVAGQVYIVDKKRIRLLPEGHAADTMKFLISGGISTTRESTGKD